MLSGRVAVPGELDTNLLIGAVAAHLVFEIAPPAAACRPAICGAASEAHVVGGRVYSWLLRKRWLCGTPESPTDAARLPAPFGALTPLGLSPSPCSFAKDRAMPAGALASR